MLFQLGSRAFFVHGFAKKDKANISDDDLMMLRELAVIMLAYDDAELELAIENKALIEVIGDE
ncbi:MAG: hypothetical protein RIQ52_2116 [Pseudomonadota bacterium]